MSISRRKFLKTKGAVLTLPFLHSFADVLADIYENAKDKVGFKKAFKEDLKKIEITKKELHAEAVEEYFGEIKFVC